MKFYRIAFFGTPETSKEILDELISAKLPNYKVELVVTNPPAKTGRKQIVTKSPVHELAIKHGIKVLTPQKLNQEFIEEFRSHKISLAVVVAFGKILPRRLLDIPDYGFLNIHYSLLPELRGAAPYKFSIFNGDTITGVTVSKIVPALDAGDIFWQKWVMIEKDQDSASLLLKLNKTARQNIVRIVRSYVRNCRKYYPDHFLVPQNENEATYANFENDPKIPTLLQKQHGRINLQWNADKIYRHILAFKDFPTSFTFVDTKGDMFRIILIDIDIDKSIDYAPVFIINEENNILEIKREYENQFKEICAGQVKYEGKRVELSFKSSDGYAIIIKEFKIAKV
jgi:methionyl-tRNA formyltransferase